MIAISPDDCEWYTPPEILDLIYQVMDIDLDPASLYPATVLARKHYTKQTDGLSKPWRGNIFLNPPYGREVGKWIDKLEEEWRSCHIKNAIILIHAKTDTKWFGKIADMAAEMCCWRGRITFQSPDGKNGKGTFPSLLILLSTDKEIRYKFHDTFCSKGTMWKRVYNREVVG